MTQKCVQCEKRFTITDSEIKFYKSKNLHLPKRCKQCREANKTSKGVQQKKHTPKAYNSYYAKKPVSRERIQTMLLAFIVAFGALFSAANPIIKFLIFAVVGGYLTILVIDSLSKKVFIQEFDTSVYKYTFYNTDSMVEHYVKHGKETHCDSMENYLYKANLVITDKASVSKRQKKDNDLVYYNKRTNEFVVVAKAGYIRTYYIASEKYYNKQ